MAIALLEKVGAINQECSALAKEMRADSLPRHYRLTECLDAYLNEKEPTELTIDNVVLALCADRRVMAGPKSLADMVSPLNESLIERSSLNVIEEEAKQYTLSRASF